MSFKQLRLKFRAFTWVDFIWGGGGGVVGGGGAGGAGGPGGVPRQESR